MATIDYPPQFQPAATGPVHVFILTNYNGKWLSRASLTKELRSALQGRGLPGDHYFPHNFRLGAAFTCNRGRCAFVAYQGNGLLELRLL